MSNISTALVRGALRQRIGNNNTSRRSWPWYWGAAFAFNWTWPSAITAFLFSARGTNSGSGENIWHKENNVNAMRCGYEIPDPMWQQRTGPIPNTSYFYKITKLSKKQPKNNPKKYISFSPLWENWEETLHLMVMQNRITCRAVVSRRVSSTGQFHTEMQRWQKKAKWESLKSKSGPTAKSISPAALMMSPAR